VNRFEILIGKPPPPPDKLEIPTLIIDEETLCLISTWRDDARHAFLDDIRTTFVNRIQLEVNGVSFSDFESFTAREAIANANGNADYGTFPVGTPLAIETAVVAVESVVDTDTPETPTTARRSRDLASTHWQLINQLLVKLIPYVRSSSRTERDDRTILRAEITVQRNI